MGSSTASHSYELERTATSCPSSRTPRGRAPTPQNQPGYPLGGEARGSGPRLPGSSQGAPADARSWALLPRPAGTEMLNVTFGATERLLACTPCGEPPPQEERAASVGPGPGAVLGWAWPHRDS
ncbi:uncharacterized protein ACOB8E_014303 [Sarcophilus harrisii]